MWMRRHRAFVRILAAGVACCTAGSFIGCVSRRISVTSEPAGALVTLNDVEIGYTPCEAEFTYYGEYDVLLELEGYEPLRTKGVADASLDEYPPVDFVAMGVPWRRDRIVRWHFTLERALEETQSRAELEGGLAERARTLRTQLREQTQRESGAKKK